MPSYAVIQKVGNIAISVQLLMQMNWKMLRAESMSMQFYICHGTLNLH